MKTKISIQKTLKNQVKTMILRGSAVVFSFVLISLTVQAQELWSQYFADSESGKTTLQANGQPSEFEKADAIRAELAAYGKNRDDIIAMEAEAEHEAEMEVESWMCSETLFGSNAASIAEEADEPIHVEPWMIQTTSFISSDICAENEEALKLEGWMLEDSNFCSLYDVQNEPLKLEAWMSDSNLWGF